MSFQLADCASLLGGVSQICGELFHVLKKKIGLIIKPWTLTYREENRDTVYWWTIGMWKMMLKCGGHGMLLLINGKLLEG